MNKVLKWFFFVLLALIIGYLVLFAKVAEADEAILTWTAPTGSEACTADSTDPDPEFYRIYQLIAEVPHPTTTYSTGPLLPGDYTFMATTVQAGTGLESRVSGSTTKTVGDLTVAEDKAYTVVKSGGGFLAFVIGTVPVGTSCNEGVMFKGEYNFQPFTGYAVPLGEVTITGDIEASAVFAVCQ